jgi:hypothetical protein
MLGFAETRNPIAEAGPGATKKTANKATSMDAIQDFLISANTFQA